MLTRRARGAQWDYAPLLKRGCGVNIGTSKGIPQSGVCFVARAGGCVVAHAGSGAGDAAEAAEDELWAFVRRAAAFGAGDVSCGEEGLQSVADRPNLRVRMMELPTESAQTCVCAVLEEVNGDGVAFVALPTRDAATDAVLAAGTEALRQARAAASAAGARP